ncbi:CLUMA_CG009562, isoform A [Clunio marinus]|uniref:CLUMA_CG009562, isoform A n=1 Tax=Clunio marinus TaxID=568069 RepID=A0A1J1I988_9DIPT|nr:CLUMA_CG009562, isoform A [Clunio marinus]
MKLVSIGGWNADDKFVDIFVNKDLGRIFVWQQQITLNISLVVSDGKEERRTSQCAYLTVQKQTNLKSRTSLEIVELLMFCNKKFY